MLPGLNAAHPGFLEELGNETVPELTCDLSRVPLLLGGASI